MVEKMRKNFVLLFSIFGLCACANIDKTPPKIVQNACSILDEKNEWEKPIFIAAREWKISPGTILAIMRQESGFRHNARPIDKKSGKKLSSALGYSQALDATWQDYEKARGKAKRKDFNDAADFIGWYSDKIHKITKVQKSDAMNLYLAFHEGPGGYNKKTYVSKPWLLNVAQKVQTNAYIYDKQLYDCETRKMKKLAKN